MTTPTREQVVRWSGDAYKNSSDYWNYMTTFAALARADLEATIAEKTKELEEMAEAIRVKNDALVRIAGDGQCPNYWWEIYARNALSLSLSLSLSPSSYLPKS